MGTVLTTKTAAYGRVTTTTPATDASDTIAVQNVYQEVTLGGTLSPSGWSTGHFVVMKLKAKSSSSSTMTFELRESDGSTVIFTTEGVSTGVDTYKTYYMATPVQITGTENFTACRLYVKQSNSTYTYTVQEDTIEFFYAEYKNDSDVSNIAWQVDSVYFISASGGEGFNGKLSLGSMEETTFVEYAVNGVMKGITWTGNSGDTLWSWAGSTIGVN